MLSQAESIELKFAHSCPPKLTSPAFTKDQPLWIKSNSHPIIARQQIPPQRFCYFKRGKRLGVKVTRWLTLWRGFAFSFEEDKSQQFLAYCSLNNLYWQEAQLADELCLIQISNGFSSANMFFTPAEKNRLVEGNSSLISLQQTIKIGFDMKYDRGFEIGHGSFSKVIEVTSRFKKGHIWAAKLIKKTDKNGKPTKTIVEEEKRVLQVLSTPFSYSMLEFYEEEGLFIFILELLPGKDLMTLLKQKALSSLSDKIWIFGELLRALEYCHSVGVVHRDLKPQNILIDLANRRCYLIDFGLAIKIGPQTQVTDYKRCGTMGYMAPEVFNNNSQTKDVYTEKVDLFSAGIILSMLVLSFNPLKGSSYSHTVELNKRCQIQFDEPFIIDAYGQPCLDLLKGLLRLNYKRRLSATEALANPFLQMKTDNVPVQQLQLFSPEYFQEENVASSEQIAIQGIKSLQNSFKFLPTT